MIVGAHALIYSKKPEADRAFLKDVLKLPHVDVGGGWLIFGLPPSEVAVHPGETNDEHELYLMCDDVNAFVAAMEEHGLRTTALATAGAAAVIVVVLTWAWYGQERPAAEARRLIAQSYASGLPDPFGAGTSYSNTRGMKMKVWTNP